jgi:hypothetical protein
MGPATKILPTIELENNPETSILSIDDDIYYPPHLLETFLICSKIYPDACITGTSFIDDPKRQALSTQFAKYVQLLEGYAGVLYKQKFLKNIDTYWLRYKSCYLGDDFYLSNEILKQNIPIIAIGNLTTPFDYGLEDDALHIQTTNDDKYKKCSDILQKNNNLYINYYNNK